MLCSLPVISIPPYEKGHAYLLDLVSSVPDHDMDTEAHIKEENENVSKQEPKSQQDSLRLRSISPDNQSLPCPLQSSTSSLRSDVF